ncbi:DUF642 domain-containing protein [Tengunoibacter tsumagoiensis]|uniref:DUF642 domain-containing protein n=1 Tax=Tengunoibacter tsumagoiensis TaxID=2014871 RepID=A0A402A6Y0_9CHLR|nr:DUF642 domain-containing protein [Tengunoibacter tsumagoiensis]GCE14849.1 hypothetical protein KTT_47080 [Tengunoibacter tsumagoiensis]
MIKTAPLSPELRPNLGAFGTETDRRLVLLLFAILAASLYMLHVELVSTFLQGMFTDCLQKSFNHPGLNLNAMAPDGLLQTCSIVPERWQTLGMLVGLFVLLSLGLLVYWLFPRLKILWNNLMPLEHYRQAVIVRGNERIHIVEFLEDVRATYIPWVQLRYVTNRKEAKQKLPSVFSGPGQLYLFVPFHTVMLFQQDTMAFRAGVLHELAHCYHKDSQKVYFARAMTLVFALVILLPFLVFMLWSLIVVPTSLTPLVKIEFVCSQFWGVLVMMGLIWLLYRSVLRSREAAADVQASYWAGTDTALAEALQRLNRGRRSWWQVLRSSYPDERELNVQQPERLFRLRPWEALATGIAASLSLPTFYFTVLTLSSALNLSTISLPALIFLGIIGSLFLCLLVVIVVGQMIWRAMLLVKLQGGKHLVGTGRLGLYLALGFVLGFLFSLQFTPFLIYYYLNWQIVLVYFGPWLLALALILAGFCRWLALLAGVWLEVIESRRMARRVSAVNLVVASIVLATVMAGVAFLCLITLGYLFPQGIDYHALLRPITLQANDIRVFYGIISQWLAFGLLPLPGVVFILIVLWAMPLFSWFWYRRQRSTNHYGWGLADRGPTTLERPSVHNPFQLGLLGETSLVLGVFFCALFLLFHQISLAVVSVEQLYPYTFALVVVPLVIAALWQGGLAALLYWETDGQRFINGLVGAFLLGVVIAIGCFFVYRLFGGALGYPVAGDQFWIFCWQVLAWGSIGTYALLLGFKGWQRAKSLFVSNSLETASQPVVDQLDRRAESRVRDRRRRWRWLWLVSVLLIIIALLLPRYVSKQAPTAMAFTGIVKDGDFEVPVVPIGSFNEYSAGQTFSAWTVAAGSVDLVDNQYWRSGHGKHSMDMDGNSAGALYQDLPTNIGGTYILSFELAANPECGDAVKTLQIWWGGKLLDQIQVSSHGYNNQQMGWHNSLSYATHTAMNVKFPYIVQATATKTRLEFISLTPGYCGAVIDLVSAVETSTV